MPRKKNLAKRKRVRRVIEKGLSRHPKCSMKLLSGVLNDLQVDSDISPLDLQRGVNEYVDVRTPVGKLVDVVDLPLKNGRTYKWPVANPFALLWVLCSGGAHFALFLQEFLGGIRSSISLYTDETTPGNNMRPDTVRKMVCVYHIHGIPLLVSFQRQRLVSLWVHAVLDYISYPVAILARLLNNAAASLLCIVANCCP